MPVEDAETETAAELTAELAFRDGEETLEERALRVARLQKEVAEGTYQVDARKLAARIVEAHRKSGE